MIYMPRTSKASYRIKLLGSIRRLFVGSRSCEMIVVSLACVLLSLFATPTLIAEESVKYTFVFNLLDWVVKTELNVPKVLEEGTVATIETSFTIMEKGEGIMLTLTNFEVEIGNSVVSTYVGYFTYAGQKRALSLTIPILGVGKIEIPGLTATTAITIRLRGYVTYADWTREDVNFTYSAPIIVQTPIAAPLVSLDTTERDGKVFLSIILRNLGPHEIYNVYTMLYVNGSYYTMKFINVMRSGDYMVFIEPLNLKPGIYVITSETSYVTVYGVNKVAVASTRAIIPLIPLVTIEASTSHTTALRTLLINGRVEPRAIYPVVIEMSTDGGNSWRAIATIKTDELGYFAYNWKPYVTGKVYLRAKVAETELYKEALSRAILLEIEKVMPIVVLSAAQTTLSVGDFTKISITVSPNARLPIAIFYKEVEASDWVLYTVINTTEDGKAEVPTQFFARIGSYVFKAVAQETDYSYKAESNELLITVKESAQDQEKTTIPPLAPQLNQPIMVIVLVASIVIAMVLYLFGRRRAIET